MGEHFHGSLEYIAASCPPENASEPAQAMFRQACRTGFQEAGFSLLKLGVHWGSRPLRQLMLDILDELSKRCEAQSGRPLRALSMSRFDQQATTKPHRDGGPPESLLLLGYEPTPVESQMRMADYSRCAHEMGLSPLEFLDRHNPMFHSGADLLENYTTRLAEFDPSQFQILLINNSSTAYEEANPRWQGVLHQATIPHPREDAARVVNSIQLTLDTSDEIRPITADERTQFLTDDALGRQYGKASG